MFSIASPPVLPCELEARVTRPCTRKYHTYCLFKLKLNPPIKLPRPSIRCVRETSKCRWLADICPKTAELVAIEYVVGHSTYPERPPFGYLGRLVDSEVFIEIGHPMTSGKV